jgi:hypothetical protein
MSKSLSSSPVFLGRAFFKRLPVDDACPADVMEQLYDIKGSCPN